MSLITAIFGRAKPTYAGVARQPPPERCAGHTLMPRWRGPQAMGDDARAMGFVCARCGREYLPVEVRNRHPRRLRG